MAELSRKSKLIRELVARFNGTPYFKDHVIGDHRGDSDFDKNFTYPPHLQAEKISFPCFRAEILSRTDAEGLPGEGWAILQLHGGGYVGAFKTNYRRMAGLYSEVGNGAIIMTPDYRVAPEHPFPAALYDALRCIDYLREIGIPENRIILAGDSAGGGLSMAVINYLIDRDRLLPAGLICMSPWTDLTASGQSYKDNYDADPVFGNTGDGLIFENPYPGHTDPRHPYISPAFGTFTGFPPTLIQVGTCEMLLDDARICAEKMKQAQVQLRYSEYEGMFHVFQIAATLMEESKRAWAEVGKFISIVMNQ